MAAAARVQRLSAQSLPSFMYVGSFTTPERGHGDGIIVYQRTGTGPWKQIQLLKDLENPSFLITDRQGRFLYAVHSDGDRASSYRIDSATGRLSLLNHQATGGQNGVHLSIDATGKLLVAANYASGTLAVLPINTDGSLAALSDLATLKGTPGPHRVEQPGSHPHHCPFDPTRRFIVVPDKGLDKVFVFRLDAPAGKLVPNDPPWVVAKAGAGPRHVDFHPTRPFAYVINELDSTMTTYHFDPATGALKPLQRLSTLPSTFTGDSTAAEIAVARSGRFVYGSNRGHDSIAIFAVDAASGTLTSVGWEPTRGTTPRYFGLDPTGAYLYAADQTSDTVVVFRVNESTGKLVATGETLKAGAPCTIAFR
jgi:6-phosphogluconolactonase